MIPELNRVRQRRFRNGLILVLITGLTTRSWDLDTSIRYGSSTDRPRFWVKSIRGVRKPVRASALESGCQNTGAKNTGAPSTFTTAFW